MMTTMIVTVIIMMLSNWLQLLLGFIGSILSGLLATYIYQSILTRRLIPKFIISDDIALSYQIDKNGIKQPTYRIKISNESKRDAFDIRTYLRLRYCNKYLTLEPPYIPAMHGKITGRDYDEYQRELPFRLSHIRESQILGFQNEQLIAKHKAGSLSFEDFDHKDNLLEIVLMATDSTSGISTKIMIKTLTSENILKSIKPGKFNKGSMTVETFEEGVCEC